MSSVVGLSVRAQSHGEDPDQEHKQKDVR